MARLAFTSNPPSVLSAFSEISFRLPPGLPRQAPGKNDPAQMSGSSLNHSGLGGADHKHQIFGCAPLGGFSKHVFIQESIFSALQFEIPCATYWKSGQAGSSIYPYIPEMADAVFSHIRRHSNGIKRKRFKKSSGILRGSIPDIPTFCIGYFEMSGGNIFGRFLQALPSACTRAS